MKQIQSLEKNDLQSLLKQLRLYNDLSKKLWNRGRYLFSRMLHEKKMYKVEFFPSVAEDIVWEQAQRIFKKSFGESPKREDVLFVSSESLKGGMKVFVEDQMVDMSFDKVEKLMQK